MNTRTLEILEYTVLQNTISEYCKTEEGKTYFLKKKPSVHPAEIAHLKNIGSSWMQALQADQSPIFKSWPPIKHFFSKLKIEGSVLSIEELYALLLFCVSVESLQNWKHKHTVDAQEEQDSHPYQFLLYEIEQLPILKEPQTLISAILDISGELKDIPALRAIKNSIKTIKKNIEGLVSRYANDEHYRSMLQSTLPTLRNSRQVIAVKSNFKGRIKGIVHEVSQSGQTIYLEPEDVVDANNQLVAEEHRLARELTKILKELTASLVPFYEAISQALYSMVFLDSIGATVQWGASTHSVFTEHYPFKDECSELDSIVALYKARHPLLGTKAVPIDLVVPSKNRMVVITGPNTGGKTVSLKTLALFALMNQSGWPLPLAEQSVLPLFDYIACDIGDEQSIDQSLSTFSAHMKNIAKIVSHASAKSLIVLDELGSGTDPQEGSAIAMAVLDTLLSKKSLVFVTTHHGILKNYAYTKEECINASVEFDHATLSPTYKIVMGIPGESHALDIAKRNGLDPAIVEQARSYLIEERADISALIQGLTHKHEQLYEFEKEKNKEELYLREKRRKTDLKELQLRQKELVLKEQGYKKLETFLSESRKGLENLVREIREGELTKDKTKEVKEWINTLEQEVQTEYQLLQDFRESIQKEQCKEVAQEKKLVQSDVAELAEGMQVLVSFGLDSDQKKGVLIRKAKKNSWLVLVDTIRLTIPEDRITALVQETLQSPVSIKTELISSDTAAFELRLLGMRHDEAVKALDVQMDAAAISGLKEFSIVHGKGQGVLQELVIQYLKDSQLVKDFCFADPEFGGSGKTHVFLK